MLQMCYRLGFVAIVAFSLTSASFAQTSRPLTGSTPGQFDANGNNSATVQATAPGECEPISVAVSFNPVTGGCGFSTNNPSVSSGSIEYSTSTTTDGEIEGGGTITVTQNNGNHSGGGRPDRRGNASGTAQTSSSVQDQQNSAAAGLTANDGITGIPVSATQTITYSFSIGECHYSVVITVSYDQTGTPYSAVARGS